MPAIRLLFLALCLAFAAGASAQVIAVPLHNFVNVAVTQSSTTAHVKTALVRSALILSWDVVEDSDGSLIVSQTKPDDFAFRFRVRYNAKRYSVTYLDSSGLHFESSTAMDPFADQIYKRAAEKHARLYETDPETRFAVKTSGFIHPFYEKSVRQWMAGVRRHLNAPI